MPVTTDPNDPRLGHGTDDKPVPQNEAYLVLSEEERAKGFVRPVRRSYMHIGKPGPRYPLRDLTEEEKQNPLLKDCVKLEALLDPRLPAGAGKYWRQSDLDEVGQGCQTVTTMGQAIAETWARDIRFYSHTYCASCQKHLSVDEFVWYGTDERLGT